MTDEIKTILTCPLGSKCREIKDGAIHQCAWHVKIAGRNPQTGELKDEWGCAVAWMPLLVIEGNQVSRGGVNAMVSLREVVNGQAQAKAAQSLGEPHLLLDK